MSDKTATLNVPHMDLTIELPISSGTLGPDVIAINQLGKNELFTIDPGFVSTASCESKITFIDGGKGILLHRGYPIEQLAEHSNYLEVCNLLLHGELPTSEEQAKFVDKINK